MSDTGRDTTQAAEDGPAPASSVHDASLSTTEATGEQQQHKTQQPEQESQQQVPAEDEPSPAESPETTHPPFEPLFTLLTNSSTNTTIHPRVHYLFSDDDPCVLTTPSEPSERALVIDLTPKNDASGWDVSWAASLSPDFAVTGAHLEQKDAQKTQGAGQDDGNEEGQRGEGMLRVEGVEREPVEMRSSGHEAGSGIEEREDADGLTEDFKRRMGVLKKVVGEGERRRVVLAREDEQQQDIHPAEGQIKDS